MKPSCTKMDYDSIILQIGGFGRYQIRICLLLCFPLILSSSHIMSGVFLGAQTDFRCLLPHESLENSTYEISPNLTNLAYPIDNITKSWSRCERYDVDLTDQYYHLDVNLSSTTTMVKCDSFVYDKTTYALTTVTEFNTVCDNAWLKTTSDSLFMLGVMLGAMIAGSLSDKYGRKPIFFGSAVINLVSGLLVAASPEIISYSILRFIVGSCACGLAITVYVIALEMVSPKTRLIAGVGMELCLTIGFLQTAGLAYFITNWRILQIATTIPSLALLVYWWFIPESIRWLLTMGRLEEAKESILKASSKNGVALSRDMLDRMLNDDPQSQPDHEVSSIFHLLRYPNLRRKSLLLCFNRFIISLTYMGLSWNTSSLGGNEYLNFTLSGLAEIPAILFVLLTLNKLGRKMILCCSLLLTGTSLLLTALVPTDSSWLMVLLTMIGKSAITGSSCTSSIFQAEQYPTVMRSVGVGVCMTCGQIGGIIAPTIINLFTIWTPLPLVIFGSGSLIAGLSALLLPETLNAKLPDSIQEGELFGRK